MKLGLLADIHEQVACLRKALDRFATEGVERVIVLGDVFEGGQHIEEVCGLLAEAKAVGVWGNHDFGLCHDPHPTVLERYPKSVLSFMGTLQPRLVVDDCQFCHIEPWLNPLDLADLWAFDGLPNEPQKLDRVFQASNHRVMFGGHYHCWLAVTPSEVLPWQGEQPLRLAEGRFFVVVNAVRDGHCAVFDTATSVLHPVSV